MTGENKGQGRPGGDAGRETGLPASRPGPEGSSPSGAKLPGDEVQDMSRTPGDGTLDGATPAGLTADQLRERAERAGETNDTGTS